MSGMKFNNFKDLLEVIEIQHFEELSESKLQFKKAVKVGNAPKKAILISKAPPKIKKGSRFTEPKQRNYGRMVHFTNAKNSIKRALKRKSQKGKKRGDINGNGYNIISSN